MKIEHLVLGMVQTNTYFIIDEATKHTIVVDPAANPERILQKIEQDGLILKKICVTHGHADHVGAAEKVKKATGAELIIHTEGKRYLEDGNYNLSAHIGMEPIGAQADRYVEEGDEVVLEGTDITLKVIHVPGHTLDGVAYYSEKYKVTFVGDILFRGNIGRTDFPGGSMEALLGNIKHKLFVLPEEVTVYSGHGETTTIGYEKRHNGHFHRFD